MLLKRINDNSVLNIGGSSLYRDSSSFTVNNIQFIISDFEDYIDILNSIIPYPITMGEMLVDLSINDIRILASELDYDSYMNLMNSLTEDERIMIFYSK